MTLNLFLWLADWLEKRDCFAVSIAELMPSFMLRTHKKFSWDILNLTNILFRLKQGNCLGLATLPTYPPLIARGDMTTLLLGDHHSSGIALGTHSATLTFYSKVRQIILCQISPLQSYSLECMISRQLQNFSDIWQVMGIITIHMTFKNTQAHRFLKGQLSNVYLH